jgi:adenylyltransferase/sulfurtransferase
MTEHFSQEEIFRYSRHLIMPEIGLEGQTKLKAASVLIVGAGGLGSPVALYLAAAGIGHIGLVDDDVVDVSNLQRQVLHDSLHEGQPKVISGKERLLALNPNISVDPICDSFTEKSAEAIAAGYDIIVDCSDNFATRYLINDLSVLTGKPDVYGAIYRFEGQVSVFDARFGPCYRCVFPEPLPPEHSPSCSDTGVIGVLPGVIGSLQAAEVIKLVLNIGSPLHGRFLIYDALETSFHTLSIPKQASCRICGSDPDLITLSEACRTCADESFSLAPADMISPLELEKQLQSKDPPLLVDVRNQVEQQVSSIRQAVCVPLDQVDEYFKDKDREQPIVVFCRTGRRSARALLQLRSMGFVNPKNLNGGINAWVQQVDSDQLRY